MALLPIRLYGDPVLRERARELTSKDIDESFREFVLNMGETMYEAAGVGLAANQVGDERRMFVADVAQVDGDGRKSRRKKDPTRRELLVLINPEILESSLEDDSYKEGCLSIPEVESEVFRPIRVKVRYRTLDFQEKEEWFEGLMARVFQHELDHLNGILFIDHLPDTTRQRLAGALNKIKKSGENGETL